MESRMYLNYSFGLSLHLKEFQVVPQEANPETSPDTPDNHADDYLGFQ